MTHGLRALGFLEDQSSVPSTHDRLSLTIDTESQHIISSELCMCIYIHVYTQKHTNTHTYILIISFKKNQQQPIQLAL